MADTLQPIDIPIAVTLVHGTFAENAEWMNADSVFRQQLQKELGSNAQIVAFNWSGSNFNTGRLLSSFKLADYIRKVSESGKPQFLIGRSHGGNVIRYALRVPGVADHVRGVVTLATPFVRVDMRPYGWLFELTKFYLVLGYVISFLAVVGVLTLVLWLIDDRVVAGVVQTFLNSKLAAEFILIPAVAAIFAAIRWTWIDPITRMVEALSSRLSVIQKKAADRLDPPNVEGIPLLVCKASADEAKISLAALYFSTEWFFFVLRERLLHGIILFAAIPIASAIAIIYLLDETLYSLPLALLAALVTVPAGTFIYWIAVLFFPNLFRFFGFGIERPLETWLLDFRFSAVPLNWSNPVVADVELPPRSWILFGRMRHSLVHQNARVAEIAGRWIARTVAAARGDVRVLERDHLIVPSAQSTASANVSLQAKYYFAAGFLAGAMFSQLGLVILYLLLTDFPPPWDYPRGAFGMSQLLYHVLLGGICALFFGRIEPSLPQKPLLYPTASAVFGALVPTLFVWFVLRPLSVRSLERIYWEWPLIALFVNGCWGTGLGLLLLAVRRGLRRTTELR